MYFFLLASGLKTFVFKEWGVPYDKHPYAAQNWHEGAFGVDVDYRLAPIEDAAAPGAKSSRL